MQEKYAQILANHAADVIRRTSRLHPIDLRVLSGTAASIASEGSPPPQDELAVRIDFQGRLSDGSPLSGYVIGGLAGRREMRPLLSAIANYLGLGDSLLDAPDGPTNLLSEFLNIIIGLAAADWAEHGLETDFSPPRNVGGQARPTLDGPETAYRLQIDTDAAARLDLLAVFNA